MKRTIGEKLQMTFGMIIMSPMLRDAPDSTAEGAKKTFWKTLWMLWTNKLD